MSVSGPGALATANVGYFSEPPNRWRRFFLFFLFAHSCVNVCVAFYIGTRARNFRYADGVPWKNGGKKIILLKSVKRTELSGTVSNMGICQLAVRCVFIGSR